MGKPKKFANHKKVEDQFYVDSDELQLLDECDSEWVEAWKTAANQLTEPKMQVLEPVEQKKKLVRIRKRR